ncbi:hypothetical protein T265_11201 [Opisthorchis viverrini]|uniref:Uncharacterized protein n=1 Tax=Opisthorchis viverrini TaxID=6198 RepID=A0A074Z3W0_OPIVI|nr:hypothetical protein T265_11201 [Opisthorchis viverrini]KER20182.1 hypothetical protein T265_11201 [Opisthorchis viverrini]
MKETKMISCDPSAPKRLQRPNERSPRRRKCASQKDISVVSQAARRTIIEVGMDGQENQGADLNSADTRAYLDKTVVPILLQGLTMLVKERYSNKSGLYGDEASVVNKASGEMDQVAWATWQYPSPRVAWQLITERVLQLTTILGPVANDYSATEIPEDDLGLRDVRKHIEGSPKASIHSAVSAKGTHSVSM